MTLSKTPSADDIAPGQTLTFTCAAKGSTLNILQNKDSYAGHGELKTTPLFTYKLTTCFLSAVPKPDYLLFKNSTNDIVEYNKATTAGVVVTANGLSYTHTITRLVAPSQFLKTISTPLNDDPYNFPISSVTFMNSLLSSYLQSSIGWLNNLYLYCQQH